MFQTFNFIFWSYRDDEIKEKLLNSLKSKESPPLRIGHYILIFDAKRECVRIFYDEHNAKFYSAEVCYRCFRKMIHNQWDDGDIGWKDLDSKKLIGKCPNFLLPDPDCEEFNGLYSFNPDNIESIPNYDYSHLVKYSRIINKRTEDFTKEDAEMFLINEKHPKKIMLALLVAEKAHEGQVDKAGVDYIQHPLKVASLVDGEKEKICALLHDVMEDTEFPESALRILFGDEIVDTLLLLTHRDGDSYEEYVEKISESELATKVKIADLTHNSDLSRLKEVTEKDLKRYEKYQKSIEFLKSKIKEKKS